MADVLMLVIQFIGVSVIIIILFHFEDAKPSKDFVKSR